MLSRFFFVDVSFLNCYILSLLIDWLCQPVLLNEIATISNTAFISFSTLSTGLPYHAVGTWPERRCWVQQLMDLLGVMEMPVEPAWKVSSAEVKIGRLLQQTWTCYWTRDANRAKPVFCTVWLCKISPSSLLAMWRDF